MVYLLQVGLIFDKPILNLYLIFSVIELNLFSSLFYPFLWYLDSVFSGPLVPGPCIFWSFGNWTLFPGHISTWILFIVSLKWTLFYGFFLSAIFSILFLSGLFLSDSAPYFLLFSACNLFSGLFYLNPIF